MSHSIDRCWSKNKRNDRSNGGFKRANQVERSTIYDDAAVFAATMVCATPTGGSMRAMWAIDSEATRHICNDKCECCEVDEGDHGRLTLANGSKTKILGVGTVNERVVLANGGVRDLVVKDALYEPSVDKNLMSIPQINKWNKSQVVLDGPGMSMLDKRGDG